MDSEQKIKTDGTKAQPIEISCTTEAPVPDSFTIKYALWTDSNKDGKIANSELSEFKEEAPIEGTKSRAEVVAGGAVGGVLGSMVGRDKGSVLGAVVSALGDG